MLTADHAGSGRRDDQRQRLARSGEPGTMRRAYPPSNAQVGGMVYVDGDQINGVAPRLPVMVIEV